MITCSCEKFETFGILCKHILYVMRKRYFATLSDWCILSRWTMESRYKRTDFSLGKCPVNGEKVVMLWSLKETFDKVIEEVKDSDADLKKLKELPDSFAKEHMANRCIEAPSNADSYQDTSQMETLSQLVVRDPDGPMKTKGRPKIA
ncbi:hypothetical protein Droror1_Dr00021556 [Drosera rotundifolia]